jgi:hypothetical protein
LRTVTPLFTLFFLLFSFSFSQYFPDVYSISGYDSRDVQSKLGSDAEYQVSVGREVMLAVGLACGSAD